MYSPLEFLLVFLKKNVIIKLRNGNVLSGILEGVDEFVNVVVEDNNKLIFVRGENISFIADK